MRRVGHRNTIAKITALTDNDNWLGDRRLLGVLHLAHTRGLSLWAEPAILVQSDSLLRQLERLQHKEHRQNKYVSLLPAM